MKTLGLALALMFAGSIFYAAPSSARPTGYGLAPSLQEFNDSAHGG